MIKIVDEPVERLDALFQTAVDPAPLVRAHDPGDQIEREDLLRPRVRAIDVESDAHVEERLLGRLLAVEQLARRQLLEVAPKRARRRAREPGAGEHLVVKLTEVVTVESHVLRNLGVVHNDTLRVAA